MHVLKFAHNSFDGIYNAVNTYMCQVYPPAKQDCPKALTLKLEVTLVLTVTQVYVFVNLCRVTTVPP